MKIAVTAQASELTADVDLRFGRAKYFVVVDTETNELEAHDNAQNVAAAQGAGIQAGQTVARLGVDAVVTGNVGPKALNILRQAGIKIFVVEGGTVGQAVDRIKEGSLTEVQEATKPGHWM